jgi:hypothetical protein
LAFIEVLNLASTHKELTQAYRPHQNGVNERKNKTFLEKAQVMLFEIQMSWFLWSKVVNTINYFTNCFSICVDYDVSPYQHLFSKPSKLHHLQVYGYVVSMHMAHLVVHGDQQDVGLTTKRHLH